MALPLANLRMEAAWRGHEQSGPTLPQVEARPPSDQRERPKQKVAVPQTADAVRARAFYEGVLGLSCLGQDAFALVFKTHHGHLRIIIAASLTPAPLTVLGWEVPDVAAGVQALMAMGVTFEIFPGMTQNELGVWTSPSDAQAAWFVARPPFAWVAPAGRSVAGLRLAAG